MLLIFFVKFQNRSCKLVAHRPYSTHRDVLFDIHDVKVFRKLHRKKSKFLISLEKVKRPEIIGPLFSCGNSRN